ncbi:MAG: sugar phosphate nucleotidyltransferase [Candidatus Nanohalobium sp.]
MKGLIPAAGKGTRMRPFTRAYPKELLPVGEKAVIEHAIHALREAGITEITVVVGWKQHAILDYLRSGEEYGVELTYVVQDDRNGLAGAIKAGEHVIGEEEDFAVVLGDNYLESVEVVKDLKEFHNEKGFDVTIGTQEVEEVDSYGIIDPGDDNSIEGMIEKPSKQEAPSNMGITGVYILSPKIFSAIDSIEKGKGDEYQLTDAIDRMRRNGHDVGYREIIGEYIDVGTPGRLREANRELDLR